MNINRSINRETKDFKTETIDNWPKIYMAIWNHPEKQLIAIQNRTAAFQKPQSAVKFLLELISSRLEKRQLTVAWEPLFEKKVFWDLISRHKNSIKEIEFEFITPNMANISGCLSDDIKEFARLTNSIRNKIQISSAPTSSLKIDESNKAVQSLVDYSSEGGGDISIGLKGLKKKIHTSSTVKELEIDEASIQGTPSEVGKMLKDLLN